MFLKRIPMAATLSAALFLAAGAQAQGVLPGKPDTEVQQFSYALGVHFGQQFKQRFAIDKIEVDTASLLAALEDVLEGKDLRLSREEMQAALSAANDKRMAAQAKAAEESVAQGKAYRERFAAGEGVQRTDSGLLYKVVEAGKGDSPKPSDRVTVNYEGRLVDGTVFDSSYKRGEPATFGVTQVIPGWQELLQIMKPGATYEVVIPPDLAYGAQGTPGIPPNSTLHFKVELVAVN